MEEQERINQAKKVLYKERPIAVLTDNGTGGIRGATAIAGSTYYADTSIGKIRFYVPHHEMGDNVFEKEIQAQLLIRWMDLIPSF